MRRFWLIMCILWLHTTPLAVAAPLQQDCSTVAITSPRGDGTPIRGRVAISGSAAIPNFQFYKLEFAPGENPPDSAFRVIGDVVRTQVNAGQLALWDTAAVPDGTYTIKLTVVDIRGNFACPPFVVKPVVIGNRAPTATPTPTPTETPTPAPLGTPTRPPAPTILVPTSAARTPTPIIGATPTPRPFVSDIDPQPYITAIVYGSCSMGSLFAFIGLLALARWIKDQI